MGIHINPTDLPDKKKLVVNNFPLYRVYMGPLGWDTNTVVDLATIVKVYPLIGSCYVTGKGFCISPNQTVWVVGL